jgi:hypothetical protein
MIGFGLMGRSFEGIAKGKSANGLPKCNGKVIFVADNTPPYNQAKTRQG